MELKNKGGVNSVDKPFSPIENLIKKNEKFASQFDIQSAQYQGHQNVWQSMRTINEEIQKLNSELNKISPDFDDLLKTLGGNKELEGGFLFMKAMHEEVIGKYKGIDDKKIAENLEEFLKYYQSLSLAFDANQELIQKLAEGKEIRFF